MKQFGATLILVGIFIAGSMVWSGRTHADQPSDCLPEDRVVAGNTNSDCKWDFLMDEVTGVRFVVLEREGANACYGALEFYPYDFADMTEGGGLRLDFTWTDKRTGRPMATTEYNTFEYDDFEVHSEGDDSALRGIGFAFDLRSPVPEIWETGYFNIRSVAGLPHHRWQFVRAHVKGKHGWVDPQKAVNYDSGWSPIPAEVSDFPVMLNACLAEVKSRLEAEAQAEEDRAKLAAGELERQQALNEEQAKATLDAQRLAAAQQALLIQQESELTKTRSLIAQLEREQIIIGVWNEIVLERLRGFQERAEITNRYLADIEANIALFNAQVNEKYAELRRLESLNQAIADSIAAHNEAIEAQLVAAAELEAKNMEKLKDLEVTLPTPAPSPDG